MYQFMLFVSYGMFLCPSVKIACAYVGKVKGKKGQKVLYDGPSYYEENAIMQESVKY